MGHFTEVCTFTKLFMRMTTILWYRVIWMRVSICPFLVFLTLLSLMLLLLGLLSGSFLCLVLPESRQLLRGGHVAADGRHGAGLVDGGVEPVRQAQGVAEVAPAQAQVGHLGSDAVRQLVAPHPRDHGLAAAVH